MEQNPFAQFHAEASQEPPNPFAQFHGGPQPDGALSRGWNKAKQRIAITGQLAAGAFAPETGTLGIPRAQMPQVRAEHRGALVNFLQARGIDSRAEEVPANDLKPTQAEFSPAKVRKAMVSAGGERSILVSSDGYVVDGHHQWLAHRAAGEPVQVIRLNAPIRQVLDQVAAFPSSHRSTGVSSTTAPTTRDAPETVAAGADESSAASAFRARQGGAQQQDRPPAARPAADRGGNIAPAPEPAAQRATESVAKSAVADTAAPAAAAPRPPARIEDFGETLHGARKMLYAEAYADGMAQAKSLDAKAHPLSKTWPEPDYPQLLEGGAALQAVSLARALREAVPTKPQKDWKLKGWASRMESLRAFAEDLITGTIDPATVAEAMGRANLERVADKAALYEAVAHRRWVSFIVRKRRT